MLLLLPTLHSYLIVNMLLAEKERKKHLNVFTIFIKFSDSSMSQEENRYFSNGLEPPNSERVATEDKPETIQTMLHQQCTDHLSLQCRHSERVKLQKKF